MCIDYNYGTLRTLEYLFSQMKIKKRSTTSFRQLPRALYESKSLVFVVQFSLKSLCESRPVAKNKKVGKDNISI